MRECVFDLDTGPNRVFVNEAVDDYKKHGMAGAAVRLASRLGCEIEEARTLIARRVA